MDLTKRIEELEQRIEKIERLFSDPTPTQHRVKKTSGKEFLLTKSLDSEVQKVLALGYFLEHIEGMVSFNASDLETAFRGARERPPKNINALTDRNVGRGFFMEAESKKDSKKAWYLTSRGERYVEDELKIKS